MCSALETDCLALVMKMKNGFAGRDTLKFLIDSIRSFSNFFDVLIWSHTRRGGNAAAHCLATSRNTSQSLFFSLQTISPELFAILMIDNE